MEVGVEALAGAVEVQSVVARDAGRGQLSGEVLEEEVKERRHPWRLSG